VVVDFYADWCGPCHELEPTLVALAGQYADRADFVRVNVDKAPDLAKQYNVEAIPLVVLIRDGKEIRRWVGVQPAEEYRNVLDTLKPATTQESPMTPPTASVTMKGKPVTLVGHAVNVGDTAPDFVAVDTDMKDVKLSDYRGKVVLLNFWASWCAPCLKELPRFSAWQRDYGVEGLQILGVSMDDDAAPVRRLLAKHPLAYPILMGDAKLGEAFGGVLGLPCSYLIDTEGRIVARFRGEGDLKQIEAQIKALLPGLHGLRGPATFN